MNSNDYDTSTNGKILLAIILLAAIWLSPAHAGQFQVGKSTRQGDYELAYSHSLPQSLHWNIQIEFIDEGKQPYPIANINRVINLDVQYVYSVTYRIALSAKLGLTCSRLSFNGSGIPYQNNTGFTGQNAGIGLAYGLSKHWSAHVEAIQLHYAQSDKTAFEPYTFAYAGLSYTL